MSKSASKHQRNGGEKRHQPAKWCNEIKASRKAKSAAGINDKAAWQAAAASTAHAANGIGSRRHQQARQWRSVNRRHQAWQQRHRRKHGEKTRNQRHIVNDQYVALRGISQYISLLPRTIISATARYMPGGLARLSRLLLYVAAKSGMVA